MSWAKLDDRFFTHPKVLSLTDGAYRVYVNGLVYCCAHGTDGFILARSLHLLHPRYRKTYAVALVTAGLWDEVDNGYAVHDFLVYQPKAKTPEEKAATVISLSERGRRGAEARWKKDA